MNIEAQLIPDLDTTNLVVAYTDGIDPFARVIAPNIMKAKSFKYWTYPKGNFRFTEKTDRAIGDPNVKQLKIPGGSEVEGFLVEHPLESEPIDRQTQGRESIIANVHENDVKERGVEVKNSLDQELTSKIITLATAISNSTTPLNKWNAGGATPGKDLRTAAIEVFKQCGRWPSHLLIPRIVFANMGDAARSEYGVSKDISDAAIVQRIILENLRIPIANMLIPGVGVYSSTTTEYEEEWGDKVMLFYTKPQPVRKDVIFMATFQPKDKPEYFQYAPYLTPQKTGVVVQGVREYLVKVVCEAAGYMLTDVLA